MEAQRFPEDFDGLMPSALVYDYTGRNTIAAAWFAQAFSDGAGGSVLNDAVAAVVHKSVVAALRRPGWRRRRAGNRSGFLQVAA